MTESGRPAREALGRSLLDMKAMSPDWVPTFDAVDRAAFLPPLIWPYDMDTRTSVAVDRATDPDAWFGAVDVNSPIVTQWDDGRHTGTAPGRLSTSSSSAPSVNYAMLHDLAPEEGMNVLDVATGTGETAGALYHRCGRHGHVTTVEIDRSVSDRARERLCAAGLHPEVVVGDGFAGHADRAPYDRVLATVGLRQFPGAWIPQTRRGGVIVAPWGTHFSNADAVVRLTVNGAVAHGQFTRPVEFMKMRAQRSPTREHKEYIPADAFDTADTSTTAVTEPELVSGRFTALPFTLGLRVRDCVQAVADKRDGTRPVWFYGLGDSSWACALFRDGERTRVWQSGPRRLWDEVEAAYRWWEDQDRPGHARFGLTVTPDGQFAWLDDPRASWPV
ncbi:protein-L-isoaspartate O-methyltransferase [Streptomyces sp. NPDC020379]|uniref:protein-L-isoaspartate O-methyltransferase n=1 Tax=Streptomyces sp. NPDC020379 TaxID=3365071 RepID=UPI0037A9B072